MWFPSFSTLAVAGALLAAVHGRPQPQNNEGSSSTACNNSPSLCDRSYNKITHLGGHNSAFLRDESTRNSLSGNQYYNATRALDAGLRLLQAQVHQGNNSLSLCHSSCELLDAGPLEDWLSAINVWMEANPNDVVTIILVNAAQATADDFGTVFESSGLGQHGYTPATPGASGDWPTLQKMIDDDHRVVFFVTEVQYSQSAPAVLPQFDYVFETHFDVTELDGFNCTLDRPSALDSATSAVSSGYLGLVNHFKYQQLTSQIQLPDIDTIEVVNSASTDATGNLGRHLDSCNSEWGTTPNFVLIDFFDEANPLDAVDRMNALSDATGRTDPPGANGTSGAVSKPRGLEFGALLAFFSAAILLV